MKKLMNALLLFIFASKVLQITGKLIVLRPLFKNVNMKLICLSEDDGSALVWNPYNYLYNQYYCNYSTGNFVALNELSNSDINCKMNTESICLNSWKKHDWTLTNSIITSMGPVFDQRWEEFKEYFFDSFSIFRVDFFPATVTLPLSLRTLLSGPLPTKISIILCKDKNSISMFCYLITLRNNMPNTFVIKKCSEIPPLLNSHSSWYFWEDKKCTELIKSSEDKSPKFFELEWKTFILSWNASSQEIIIYDTEKVIISYKGMEEDENSNDYNMFIQSSGALLRFHKYDFLHTTVENAILSSPIFQFNDTICIQMFIGLCAECEAHIVLRDPTTDEELERVTVRGSWQAAIPDLPMWQSVKIKRNISSTTNGTYNRVIMQLIPKLNEPSVNPLWAIANVRQCPQNEALRQSVLKIDIDTESELKKYTDATCQKLFYNENTVVNAISGVKQDIRSDSAECSVGKIGPQCMFSCQHDLGDYFDCRETLICYEDGCMCSPGFQGDDCSPCESNTYGYGCKKSCGTCNNNTLSEKSCNKITGVCSNGCYNLDEIYIPPLCQTTLDKPRRPIITSVNETSVRASVRITWKDEYESILYSFDIKGQKIQSQNRISRYNVTFLTGYFENLTPGTTYEIRCRLSIAEDKAIFGKRYIDSDWQSFDTLCNPPGNFTVIPEGTGIIIDYRINPDQLYVCSENSYHLKVENKYTYLLIIDTMITHFPFKLEHLPIYSILNVNLYYKTRILFSESIRTLEGVPSEVLNLQERLNNTLLILTWRPPSNPNGEIIRYEIILKIIMSYGCRDLKLVTPINHIINISTTDTKVTIPDLHPYTSYCAQIIAHNSRYSSITEKVLDIAQSEVPSETIIINQLRVQDWKLLWNSVDDCTTISGPIKFRIEIYGISNAIKNFIMTITTLNNFLDLNEVHPKLNGGEIYIAKIYAIRKYLGLETVIAYQAHKFETPPTAPPKIINLEVVEIDTREVPIIHLRWQSPFPPLNGKLRDYGIQFCDTNNTCVFAYNVNVTEPGPSAFVTEKMLNNIEPDAPGNCTLTINNNSVIDLTWFHPWKTGDHLRFFRIRVIKMSSNLRNSYPQSSMNKNIWTYEYPVIQYMRNYSKRLYLLPSTQYFIDVQTITIENRSKSSNFMEIYTPSTARFDGELNATVHKSNFSILSNIPFVVNDTLGSILRVIVKGPKSPCDQHLELSKYLREQVGLKMNEVAWQAAEVPTNELVGKVFMIGDNKTYGNAKNCPLKPNEFYKIMVMVTEKNLSNNPIILAKLINTNKVSSMHHGVWFIPLVIYLVIASISCYLCQRKYQQPTEELMPDVIIHQNSDHEYESISAVSYSEQDISSIADRQSLSSGIISEVLPLAIINDSKEEEILSSLVKVEDFEDYVQKAIQSNLLDKQYKMLPGQSQPCNYGKLPENKFKNRYRSVVAYDKTRVILQKLPDNAYSDYINANYISGYEINKRYIATQGPTPTTVSDFWRMIWQKNVHIICMLTNVVEDGKIKCEQYWPDVDEKEKKYGDINVLNVRQNVFADYCFRTLSVTYKEETRKVQQLHYTAWPDYNMPLYTHSIVTYLNKLSAISENKPVVVHCSGGIGRTGVIILCDICLRRARMIDVFAQTASMMNERANIINNTQQYLLAHLILIECLFSVPISTLYYFLFQNGYYESLPTRIEELKEQIPILQQRLQHTVWRDKALGLLSTQVTPLPSLSERNRAKNRFPELISNMSDRIYLKRYPEWDEDSDYISGVYVDGVTLQKQYLATQLPMPSTINDFWRMIAEFRVELVLMLQPPDLQDTKSSREQFVTILCLTEWKPGRNQSPPPVTMMVNFWLIAKNYARGSGPIVTLCHDGAFGCGLYLALSFLLERMTVEKECNVYIAVRAVKRSRPDFVLSLEHLEYLCNAALAFEEMKNFKS
ncbi:hypothetical protein P5V15_006583 [Pogonomyrmex californicus]